MIQPEQAIFVPKHQLRGPKQWLNVLHRIGGDTIPVGTTIAITKERNHSTELISVFPSPKTALDATHALKRRILAVVSEGGIVEELRIESKDCKEPKQPRQLFPFC